MDSVRVALYLLSDIRFYLYVSHIPAWQGEGLICGRYNRILNTNLPLPMIYCHAHGYQFLSLASNTRPRQQGILAKNHSEAIQCMHSITMLFVAWSKHTGIPVEFTTPPEGALLC